MKTNFVIYRRSTGEIVSTGGGVDFRDPIADVQIAAALAPWGDDYGLFEATEGSQGTHYIVMLDEVPVAVERPPIPYQIDSTTVTAGDGSYITITGLHNPCELVIDDPDPTVETWRVTVEGGGFEFECETPGIYTVEISRFPFLPARIEITAT
jgi:hypothetical protein